MYEFSWIHLWRMDSFMVNWCNWCMNLHGCVESHWCRLYHLDASWYVFWIFLNHLQIVRVDGSRILKFESTQIQIRVSFCWWWSHKGSGSSLSLPQLEVSRGCQKHSEGVPSAKDFATRKVWQWHLLARKFFSLSLRANYHSFWPCWFFSPRKYNSIQVHFEWCRCNLGTRSSIT